MSTENATGVFPAPDHDHGRCISRIMDRAERLCVERGARFTAQRRQVFAIILESHAAVGAYDIIDRMGEAGGRRPAPAIVYRALDFLIDQGLAHRISALNAFVACCGPEGEEAGGAHGARFLICQDCGVVAETQGEAVDRSIRREAMAAGFAVAESVVEVMGTCRSCRTPGKGGAP